MLPLTRAALRAPRRTALLALAVTLALGAGLPRLRADPGFGAYLGADHAAVRELEQLLARFGGGLPIAVVWSCAETAACEDVFDARALEMAHDVASALRRVPGVAAVASPATSPLLVPAAGGFAVRRLFEAGRPAADRARLRERAGADPSWVGQLVSADADVGALVIELTSARSALGVRVLRALQESLAPWEQRGFRFHLVGDPVELVIAGGELQADAKRLLPLILTAVGAMFFALFRSLRVVSIALASVAIAVAWSFGAMGWLGWPTTAVTPALAPFIVVVGICNASHLVARYEAELARAASREQALLAVVADVGSSSAVASAASAGGFASFAASGAPCFLHFGAIAAFGALASLVLCFTLLPVWLARAPFAGPGSAEPAFRRALELVVDGSQRRAPLVLGGTLLLCAVAAIGLTRLHVEVDVYHLFGEQTRVVRWIRFVEERLREPDTLDVVLTLPAGRTLADPELLARVAELSRQLSALPGLGGARSLLGPLSRLNRVVHGDVAAFERPADTAAGNAELLARLASRAPELLSRFVSADGRRTRIEVGVKAGTQSSGERVLARVRELLASELVRGLAPELGGPVPVFVQMVAQVERAQRSSFAMAALVVAGIVAASLRSPAWALAVLLPTLFPVLMTLALMGLCGVYLDLATALIPLVVLGVAIDASVHLLAQYRRGLAAGRAPADAIRAAVLHAGRALVTSALSLSLGFFVLTLSSWESVASFGFLSGSAILLALAAALVILPAAIAAGTLLERSRAAWLGS